MRDEPYLPPNWMLSHVGNRMAALFGRRFLSRLTVPGRSSGRPRSVPVAVLEHEGCRYLIAPRGRTHWVRNLRASGEGVLRHDRGNWTFTAEEVPVEQRATLIAEYRRQFDRFPTVAESFERLPDPADHPTFRLTQPAVAPAN
jgi:deazaflavin-dependent oxidoreductase (nitroreductase family)